MVRFGIGMGLELPLTQSDVHEIFRLREMELRRFVVAVLVQMRDFVSTVVMFAHRQNVSSRF
jgi:hypothetical protein